MPCAMCHDTGHYYVVGSRKEAIPCDCLKGLEERIATKSREIAATGLCQWKTRTAEEIAALPDDPDETK